MLCCIGGVCVPYTAVLPLLVLGLKWIATKLAQMGVLPKAIADLLQVDNTTNNACATKTSCCSGKSEPLATTSSGPSKVQSLDSQEHFDKLIGNSNNTVVCKFTASWCKPCHKIQPFFESLSSQNPLEFYNYTGPKDSLYFVTIDVDDYDAIASKYKVAMMPTFVIVRGDQVLGTYSGSNEHELQQFLKRTLTTPQQQQQQ